MGNEAIARGTLETGIGVVSAIRGRRPQRPSRTWERWLRRWVSMQSGPLEEEE